jgi:LmbE family N-acetylglucosaminyl deacetylase
VPTAVFVHPHPDDEAIFTGGLLALAASAGWRTVVVFATTGELGGDDHAAAIAAVRRREAERACEILGVHAVEFLGFHDSGMAGSAANDDPRCLAASPVPLVADRLAALVRSHGATTLTSYDEGGIYGHPDHVAVHRAARLVLEAGLVAELAEATVDRDELHAVRDDLVASGRLAHESWPREVVAALGAPEVPGRALALDVSKVVDRKREAIAAHASQVIVDDFMGIPAGAFERLLDREWFHPTGPVGPLLRSLTA